MSFAGLEKLAPRSLPMGFRAGPAPLSPTEYVASNGISLRDLPVTEEGIHHAIAQATPDTEEYWALIEYLGWFTEKIPNLKTVPFWF